MEFSLTPSYNELFGSECPDPQSLISDLKSEHVITYLSLINTQLYMGDEEDEVFQKKLLSQLLFYWLPDVRNEFLKSLSGYLSKHSNPNFFKSIYVTHFIHYELLSYKAEGKAELTSKDELQIIRAYFGYIEKFNKDFNIDFSIIQPGDPLTFQKSTWPFLLKQLDFNEKIDPIYQHLRAALVLEHFYLNDEYRPFVDNYLKIYNKEAIWNLMMDMMNVINVGFNKRTDGSDMHNFLIRDTPGYTTYFENFSIDVNEYKSKKELQKDFLGIRQKPILKISNEIYVVLSWKFLYNSIYLGTLFDFKNRSGIESKINYNTFKSIIGEEVSERVIFRKLMEYSFETYHCKIRFSESTEQGAPDCYLRIGKYIFLFEFKDYLMPTNVICSNSFDVIKKHIDEGFIANSENKGKGVTQLLNQIVQISSGGFDFDKYEEVNLKKRNLIILPIIITTTYHYEMPGINTYLSDVLSSKIAEQTPPFGFNKIVPLTMIDFGFLYRQFIRIRNKEIDLRKLAINHHHQIKESRDPFSKQRAFEATLPKEIRSMPPAQKEPGFIDALFKALNINPERTNKKNEQTN